MAQGLKSLFGLLDTGKIKIRRIMARKATPLSMSKDATRDLPGVAGARSLEDLRRIESKAREVYRRYLEGLGSADIRELAIHRRVSRLNYLRICAEASAVRSYQKRGLPLAPGMEIGYVVTNAAKWDVDPERDASEFDAGYYRGLFEKASSKAAFVFRQLRLEGGANV